MFKSKYKQILKPGPKSEYFWGRDLVKGGDRKFDMITKGHFHDVSRTRFIISLENINIIHPLYDILVVTI